MPIALKDNIDVAGVRTTAGSRLFEQRVAKRDAEVVGRLRAAGAVIVGKTNMHELAFGATSRNETFGYVVNPTAPDRIPGGSSGGSAAAVAADLCLVALGTDTGGSIRLPAAMCGVSGIRPTFGTVSCQGVQPVSPSLDTVGPLARWAHDLSAVLAVLAGLDDMGDTGARLTALRVGLVAELVDASDPTVATAVRRSPVCWTTSARGWSAWTCRARPPRRRRVEADQGRGARRLPRRPRKQPHLFEEGTAPTPGARRRGWRRDRTGPDGAQTWTRTVGEVFERFDLLLLPTIPVETPTADGAETVATTAAVVPYTHALSLAQIPSLSLPCAPRPSGAPIGAQLAGAPGADGLVLRAAAAIQSVTDWHRRRARTQPAGSTLTTS